MHQALYSIYFQILKKAKNGCKYFYSVLNNCEPNPRPRIRWSEKLEIDITPVIWQAANRICLKTIDSNEFKWFQYRILNRILGTREYLVKLRISDSATCAFCEGQRETIIHLFTSCNKVENFWEDINSWLSRVCNFQIPMNPVYILLGVTDKESYAFQKNFILLTAKKYIFFTSHKRRQTFLEFQPFFNKIYSEQKYLAKLSLRKINLVQSGAISYFYNDRIELDQQLSHKINCARYAYLVQYMAGIFCAFLFLFLCMYLYVGKKQ